MCNLTINLTGTQNLHPLFGESFELFETISVLAAGADEMADTIASEMLFICSQQNGDSEISSDFIDAIRDFYQLLVILRKINRKVIYPQNPIFTNTAEIKLNDVIHESGEMWFYTLQGFVLIDEDNYVCCPFSMSNKFKLHIPPEDK